MLKAANGAECKTWMAKLVRLCCAVGARSIVKRRRQTKPQDAAILSSTNAAISTAAVLNAAQASSAASNPHALSFRRSSGAQFECKVRRVSAHVFVF